jgi:uncharacterized protein YdcH (DUF465 family)
MYLGRFLFILISLATFECKLKVNIEDDGLCNLPIEYLDNPPSQEEFLEKYAFKQPVVFRRAKHSNRNALFEKKCQLDNMVREYGDKYVTVSTANTYSYKRQKIRLEDYLNEHILGREKSLHSDDPHGLKYGNETWYFFGENNYTEWASLLDFYERPEYTLPNREHAYSFGVAGFYTGVG